MRFSISSLVILLLLTGCATKSTVASRKIERPDVYAALSQEYKSMVDSGQIRVGMKEDAVYLAWGSPDQITKSENASSLITTWIYMGTWLEESRYWTYREVSRENGTFLERYLDRDYFPRDYVSAELNFEDGTLKNWRTLPRPGY